jgi:multidrug transporter EmrE-like cation transporter
VIVFFVEVFALAAFSFGQGQQSRALHPEQGPPWWEMLRATWFTPAGSTFGDPSCRRGLFSPILSSGGTAMYTTLTGLAAVSFSIGGYFMKLSAGLTHLRPTLLMVGFFSVGTVLQTVAMRGEQMAITYIVVLGFEAIAAFALSVFLLNEGSSLPKFAGVALVLAGIVLLRSGKA